MQAAANVTEATMPERRPAFSTRGAPKTIGELKDEVYRHMLRLEAHRPGAEQDLTLALLRAWMTAGTRQRPWLKKICPVCLALIEAVRKAENAGEKKLGSN
jgi:hypothetical protein